MTMQARSDEQLEHEQLEHELNRTLSSPEARFGVRMRKNLSAEGLQDRVMETEAASLESTFAHLRASAAVPQAAAIILGSRRKFIAGAGKSAAYAALLNADLAATVPNVYLIDGHALNPLDVLSDVRSTDVLILFSLRRYRRETVTLGRLFSEAGGQLVVFTDSDDAPLAPFATSLIVLQTGSASYADSPTSVAAVCHLLSTLTTASAKGARRRLATRDELNHEMNLYFDHRNDEDAP
ncbi:MurR/RpiR family transcriptional regulator [Agromyces sp. NPDC056379]|uniref:MurR/RpiR family transcriptional regulator n=1 Tax=unclassified Agromyces TaxID=2639701 RepID=UPI0035D79E01